MKIASIIAEYNPFHNGHLYQINKIKKEYSDYIVVIMSPNFVQRGEPSIINKFKRAEVAINNGASLVIENPVLYATSNAEIFAKGAINILNSMDIIDKLYFGSEDDFFTLKNILNKIDSNLNERKIKFYLDKGESFIKSRELSMDFLTQSEKEILKRPNNILGIEYIKAIKYFNSNIVPFSIDRKYVNHDDVHSYENFASASFIRNSLINGKDVSEFIPDYNLKVQNKLENYFDIFKYKLISDNINFNNYLDYEIGLENRMIDNLNAKNFNEFIEKVHSKRHSKSRIKRLIISILLDIDKNLIKDSFNFPYTRVLACDKRGIEILRNSKNKNKIYSFKRFYDKSSATMRKMLDKEILATNLYNLKSGIINEDFTREVYKKPGI